jgi:hypothetical protein
MCEKIGINSKLNWSIIYLESPTVINYKLGWITKIHFYVHMENAIQMTIFIGLNLMFLIQFLQAACACETVSIIVVGIIL